MALKICKGIKRYSPESKQPMEPNFTCFKFKGLEKVTKVCMGALTEWTPDYYDCKYAASKPKTVRNSGIGF